MNHFEPIWAKYYAPHLTKTEVNQLRRAEGGSQSLLLTHIIQKQGFDPSSRTYMPVARTKDVRGRNHYAVADLIEGRSGDWDQHCLFANALRVAAPEDDDFRTPSARVTVAPYHILTIEFDVANVGFFKQQLGWFRSSRNLLDSVIGKFVSQLRSKYADVAGATVVYSGHKSFHFHFVVSTAVRTGAVPYPISTRLGFERAWDRLQSEFQSFTDFALPTGMAADKSLRQPEQFRRLPGGMRLNDNDGHLFGVPPGEPLFQGVMWEYLKLDRGGGGKETLLDPADFMLPPISVIAGRRPASTLRQGATALSEEDNHAAGKLAALFDGSTLHPKFSHLDRSSGEPVAYFYNHRLDQHPTSVMRPDFPTVLLQGANPLGLTNDSGGSGMAMNRLPHPLRVMLDIWADEFRRQHVGPGGRVRSPVEDKFAELAVDKPSATRAMADILLGSITGNIGLSETRLLCAPEGISKTRSLMQAAPTLIRQFRGNDLPGWLMFAFPSYEGAKAKADEFAVMHAADMQGMVPVLLPSFDKMYRDLCGEGGYLSHERAVQSGYASRWDMIRTEQPEIAQKITSSYAALRATMVSGAPVIFTVHDVAQSWGKDTQVRLMLSADDIQCPAQRLAAREATRLGLLVHDEVEFKDMLEAVPSEQVEEIRELAKRLGWTTRTASQERWRTFRASGCKTFKFEDVCRIAAVPEADWEQVTTSENFEYGRCLKDFQDIYAAANFRRWHIRRKNWAKSAAHKTAVLTTEFVPLILAEHIGEWQTTCLDTPRLVADVTSVRPDRTLTTRNAARHVLAARSDHSAPLFAIGNKLGHLADAETHLSAKGSNAYIGKDVVQTLTMMPPEQYAVFQALNAWTGRNDLARIAHIDQFNQTAGRNLGFRKSGAPLHRVLIHRRLFDSLPPVMSYARYDLLDDCVEVSTKLHRRRAEKAKAARRRRSPALRRLVVSLKAERRKRRRREPGAIWLTDRTSMRA